MLFEGIFSSFKVAFTVSIISTHVQVPSFQAASMSWATHQRVEVFLPCNDDVAAERYAVAAAEAWMRERFGGATASTKYGPVFHGYYRSGDRWIDDQIVVIMADTSETTEELAMALGDLHRTLTGLYQAAQRTQEEFWITVAAIQRFVPEL